jgi:hypothetical protein
VEMFAGFVAVAAVSLRAVMLPAREGYPGQLLEAVVGQLVLLVVLAIRLRPGLEAVYVRP